MTSESWEAKTKRERGHTWAREDADGTCVDCMMPTFRHRCVNPQSLEERKAGVPRVKLVAFKRCYLCAAKMYEDRRRRFR